MTDVKGVTSVDGMFEAFHKRANVTAFTETSGALTIIVDDGGEGYASFNMIAEQVAAFKVWLMEN